MPIAKLAALSPRKRRIVQAMLYESLAVILVTPAVAWLFNHPLFSAMTLSALMSGIALAWNYSFNTAYEHWEARQAIKGRTLLRRLVHGAAFELGLMLFLIPLMAYWLDVSLLTAFIADIGIMIFFFFYTIAFTWLFDQLFGLPQSAHATREGARG
ncbi:PACE efflux transporter [Uliginosibacterium sediminicola]|uniref:PACE efflux transporter n=1 Tax=Uliginosibacterium sediminicola TaxID=2024550 RepID=A0ABU9YTQ7_9RHOO